MTTEIDLRRLDQVVEALGTPVPDLVAGIVATLTQTIESLHTHLQRDDLQQAARTAHTCRNDALLVGARALLTTLNEIEQGAREGDAERVLRGRAALDEIWPATRAALAEAAQPGE